MTSRLVSRIFISGCCLCAFLSSVACERNKAPGNAASTLPASDTPAPRPTPSVPILEPPSAKFEQPLHAEKPLEDVGIFSELDEKLETQCPPWLLDGAPLSLSRPGRDERWITVEGIPVCLSNAPTTRAVEATQTTKRGDRDGDGIFDALDILRGAKKTVLNGAAYKNSYVALDYPGGDVPRTEGVCTDVIIRSLRNAGLDLQKEVQDDIAARPDAYPMVKKPDPHIDHRRVRTLLPYFSKNARSLSTDARDLASPYLPGDIVFMNTMGDGQPEHMGIVSDRIGRSGLPLLINNWNDGTTTAEMDLLGRVPVTHRFRFAEPPEVSPTQKGLLGVLARHDLSLAEGARQVILVTLPLWQSSGGVLTRWERGSDLSFRTIGPPVFVRVGSAGLGLGRGLHDEKFRAPVPKREGDKKAPAGMFSIGTAFGRAARLPVPSVWPYRQTTSRDYFVDAPASPRYNSWVRLAPGEKMDESAEHLPMYEWGLVVEHNMPEPRAGAGSAIFLHPYSSVTTPTVGCTAMDEARLLEILSWLEPESRPVLVQIAGHVFQ